MRLSINLATRPFIELRPIFQRLRIAMAALAVLAIGLGIGTHLLSKRAQVAQDKMDALKARTLAFQTERQTNERRMQQPNNKAVLDRSHYLNALFTHKSFSWTAVMMDLERVLPAGVQVTSIEPQVSAEGEVTIRLRVSGERDRAVELVRNLERSQRFLEPHLANESAQTQEGHAVSVAQQMAPGAVEFDILSGYNPLSPETPLDKKAKANTTADQVTPKPRTAPKPPAPSRTPKPGAPTAPIHSVPPHSLPGGAR